MVENLTFLQIESRKLGIKKAKSVIQLCQETLFRDSWVSGNDVIYLPMTGQEGLRASIRGPSVAPCSILSSAHAVCAAWLCQCVIAETLTFKWKSRGSSPHKPAWLLAFAPNMAYLCIAFMAKFLGQRNSLTAVENIFTDWWKYLHRPLKFSSPTVGRWLHPDSRG